MLLTVRMCVICSHFTGCGTRRITTTATAGLRTPSISWVRPSLLIYTPCYSSTPHFTHLHPLDSSTPHFTRLHPFSLIYTRRYSSAASFLIYTTLYSSTPYFTHYTTPSLLIYIPLYSSTPFLTHLDPTSHIYTRFLLI